MVVRSQERGQLHNGLLLQPFLKAGDRGSHGRANLVFNLDEKAIEAILGPLPDKAPTHRYWRIRSRREDACKALWRSINKTVTVVKDRVWFPPGCLFCKTDATVQAMLLQSLEPYSKASITMLWAHEAPCLMSSGIVRVTFESSIPTSFPWRSV